MKKGDIALTPQIAFTGTKATITAWAGAVLGMEAVTTDTAEKGTYDGAAWQWSPIAGGGGGGTWGSITGALSSQTDLQIALDGKINENAPITGATKTKITYDVSGLITSGTDATTADIDDSTNKRYVTDAELTVIGNTSGTNTGDSASQPLDSDLTAIAGLTPSNDDIIQRKAGSWVGRSISQLITDLTTGLSALFAPVAKGVSNGDSHDHNGGDGAQIAHSSLSGAGSNSHATIDAHLADTSDPHGSSMAITSDLSTPRIVPQGIGISIAKNSNANILSPRSGLALVIGAIANNNFAELVLFQAYGTCNVISSVQYGTPPARTYSSAGGSLNLALNNTGTAGSYAISLVNIA